MHFKITTKTWFTVLFLSNLTISLAYCKAHSDTTNHSKPLFGPLSSLNLNKVLEEPTFVKTIKDGDKDIKYIEKDASVDCIFYNVTSDKNSYQIGETVKIKIKAQFYDNLNLSYKDEDCQKITLKVVLPKGFVQDGGSYYDFIQLNFDKINNSQELEITGHFTELIDKPCFVLLKGPKTANWETIFVKKGEKCITIGQATNASKPLQLLNEQNLGEDIAKGYESKAITATCSTPTTANSTGTQYCSYRATGTGCTNGNTYTWYNSNLATASPIGTGSTFVFNSSGTYYVTCSSSTAACSPASAKKAFTVTVTAIQALNNSTSSVPLCSSTTLGLRAVIGSGSVYSWTGPNGYSTTNTTSTTVTTTTNITNTTAAQSGIYTLTVIKNGSTCLATTQVYINQTPVNPTGVSKSATSVCSAGPLSLTANCSIGTLKWYTALTGGTALTFTTNYIVNPTANTTYYAACENGTCKNPTRQSTGQVTINALPAIPTAASASATSVCPGVNFNLNATCAAGTTATWYLAATGGAALGTNSSLITNNQNSGTYTYYASCRNNTTSCESSTRRAIATAVTILPKPADPVFAIVQPTCSVSTGTINITPVSGVQYKLDNGVYQTSGVFNSVAPGNHTLTARLTSNSCLSSVLNATISAAPSTPQAPNIIGSAIICSGQNTTLTASVCSTGTLVWSNGATAASISVSPITTTNYTATCNLNGCSSVASNTVTVSVTQTPTAPTVSGNATICLGQSTNLSSSTCAIGNLVWSNGATAGIISVSPTITTTYTATCSNIGCPSIISNSIVVSVETPPVQPTLSSTIQPTCIVSTGSFQINNYNTAHAYTFSPTGGINISPTGLVTAETGSYNFTETNTNGCVSPASEPVVINPQPTIPAIPTASITQPTCTEPTGTITVTTPALGVNYSFDNGVTFQPSAISAALVPGTYQVKVNDIVSSCESQATSVVINVLPITSPIPTVAVNGPTTFCTGGIVSLTASGCLGEIKWSNGFIGNPLFANTSATYTATCKNDFQCESTASQPITVIVNPIVVTPTISVNGSTTFCQGGTVTLTANGCSGTVEWRDFFDFDGIVSFFVGNGPTLEIQNLRYADYPSPTSYAAFCTENGCTSEQSEFVNIEINPTPQIPTLTGTATICNGNNTTLTATGCSGTVTWSTGATGASLTVAPNISTDYTATCKNGFQCESQASLVTTVVVNPIPTTPTISVSGSATFCQGDSVTLTANGCNGTVEWRDFFDFDGLVSFFVGNGATLKIKNLRYPGYPVPYAAFCIENGCPSEQSEFVNIEINPTPTAPTITASTTTICGTGTSTLTASNCTGTIVWSNGQTGLSTIVSTAGNYTAKCQSALDCESGSSNLIAITLEITPIAPIISRSGNASICEGISVTLMSSNCSGNIIWSTGETGSSISVNPSNASSYSAVCVINGCSSNTSNVLIIPVLQKPSPPSIANANGIYITSDQIMIIPTPVLETYASFSVTGCGTNQTIWPTGVVSGNHLIKTNNEEIYATCKNLTTGCISDRSFKFTLVRCNDDTPVLTVSQTDNSVGCKNITLTVSGCSPNLNLYNFIETDIYGNSTGYTEYSNTRTTVLRGDMTYKAFCYKNAPYCTSNKSNSITLNPIQPSNRPQVINNNKAICNGNSVLMEASGCTGGVIKWYSNSALITLEGQGNSVFSSPITLSPTAASKVPFTYYSTCTINNCESIATSFNFIVYKNAPLLPTVTPAGPLNICTGTQVTLSASCASGIRLEWSQNGIVSAGFNSNTNKVTPTQDAGYFATCIGEYSTNANNPGGCASAPSNITFIHVGTQIPPTPILTATKTTICQGSTEPVVLSAANCNGTTNWQWTNADLSAGTATSVGNLTVSDITQTRTYKASCTNGCGTSALLSADLVINYNSEPLLAPDISYSSNGTTVNAGESITLTASNCSGQVIWSNGEVGSSIIISNTIDISAKCSQGGCESESSPTVSFHFCQLNEVTAPSLSILNEINQECANYYNLNSSGCTSGTEILWSSKDINGNSLNAFSNSNYFGYNPVINGVRAIENAYVTAQCTNLLGCKSSPSQPLLLNGIDNPPTTPIITSNKLGSINGFFEPNFYLCYGESITLEATNCNGTITWIDNGVQVGTGNTLTYIPNYPQDFNYSTSAICQFGSCTSVSKFNLSISPPVTVPSLVVNKTDICLGESVTLTATTTYNTIFSFMQGERLVWSNGQIDLNFKLSNPKTLIVTPNEITTYSARQKSNLFFNTIDIGCFSEPSNSITINVAGALPPTPILSSSKTTICQGSTESVVLSAANCNGTTNWQWTNADLSTGTTTSVGNLTVSDITQTRTYRASCTNGCGISALLSADLVINVQNLEITSVTSNTPVNSGAALNFTLVSALASTYSWAGPNTFTSTLQNPSITSASVTNSGTYTVTVTSIAGCTATATIAVVVNPSIGCDFCDQATNVTQYPSVNPNFTYNAIANVVVNEYLKPTTTIPTVPFAISQTIQYYDGFGRNMQTVLTGLSPNGKDIVQPVEYDAFGRVSKNFLPYEVSTSNNNGNYRPNAINTDYALSEQSSFFTTLKGDGKAFSEVEFENSPLNRVFKQGDFGTGFELNSTKTLKQSYKFNSKTDIKKIEFNFDDPNLPYTISNYGANELYVVETKDEKDRIVESYSNIHGQMVCKILYNGANYTDALITYNAYDNFGRLRMIFPPKAADNLRTFTGDLNPYTNAAYKDLVFWYDYDGRGRTIKKKGPSTSSDFDATYNSVLGEEEYVYNRFNQVVLYRNGQHKAKRQWLYTKYDVQGRVVNSGVFVINSGQNAVYNNRQKLQQVVNADWQTTVKYEDDAFPSGNASNEVFDGSTLIGAIEVYTKNYYDNYSHSFFNGKSTPVSIPSGKLTVAAMAPNIKGQLTGTWEKVLNPIGGNATLNTSLETVVFYDEYMRAIHTRATNHTLAAGDLTTKEDVTWIEYAFDGSETKSYTENNFKKSAPLTGYIKTTNLESTTYDVGGRVVAVCQQINDGIKEPVARYTYYDNGELKEKTLGCDVQKVKYETNIRGWLMSINDPTKLKEEGKYFGMKLTYDTDGLGLIKNQEWATINKLDIPANEIIPARKYEYSYDGIDRLTSALYSGGVATANEQYNVHDLSYDKHGNILTMKRTINGLLQDNLNYIYENSSNNTNTLASVNEGPGGLSDITKPWFRDHNVGSNNISTSTTAGSSDYAYDVAGNLIKDLNKKILNITYNALNLPDVVDVKDNAGVTQHIYYTYTASGEKLRKQNYDQQQIEYIEGLVYTNSEIEFIPTAEGRALPPITEAGSLYTDWRYEYQMEDHLGNLRVAVRTGDPIRDQAGVITGLAIAQLVQENHYDPWGLNLAGIEIETTSIDRFQFNGRTEKGLLPDGSFDYETPFRMYDASIGRFKSVDALSHTMAGITPFNFGNNNPVKYNDPSGLISSAGIGALIGTGVGFVAGGFIGGANDNKSGAFNWGWAAAGAGAGALAGAGVGQLGNNQGWWGKCGTSCPATPKTTYGGGGTRALSGGVKNMSQKLPPIGVPLTSTILERLIDFNGGGDLDSKGNYSRLKGEVLEELFSESTLLDRNYIRDGDPGGAVIDFRTNQYVYDKGQLGWSLSISMESKAYKGNYIGLSNQIQNEINITAQEKIFGGGMYNKHKANFVGIADFYFITFDNVKVSEKIINYANARNVGVNYLVPYIDPTGNIYFQMKFEPRSTAHKNQKGWAPLEVTSLTTFSFFHRAKVSKNMISKLRFKLNL